MPFCGDSSIDTKQSRLHLIGVGPVEAIGRVSEGRPVAALPGKGHIELCGAGQIVLPVEWLG